MNKTIPRIKINEILIEKILLVFVAVCVSFPIIMPQSKRMISVFLILLLMVHAFYIMIKPERTRIPKSTPLFLWVIFFLYIMVDRGPLLSGSDSGWVANFFCIFAYLLLNAKKNPEIVLFFIKTLVVVDLVNALATIIFWIIPSLYPIYENIFLSDQLRIVGKGYRSALTSHYSTNGMLISVGLLASYALLSSKERKYKIIFFIDFFALILTTKRAHLIFSAVAIMAVFWFSNHNKISKKMKYVILIILIVVIWYIAAQFIPDLWKTIERFDTADNTNRLAYWNLCFQMFKKSPLIGNGWESFTTLLYTTPLGDNKAIWGNTTQNAHNVYFQVLAEQGIIGEILFLISIAGTYLYSLMKLMHTCQIKVRNKQQDVNLICLRFTLAMQTFFILYCLTGNPLYDRYINIPLFMSFGICCCFAFKRISLRISCFLENKENAEK